MKFIDMKTEGGSIKGKISMYCRVLGVSRQGFHNYLEMKKKPLKYEKLVRMMKGIIAEDEYNDTYGRQELHWAAHQTLHWQHFLNSIKKCVC